MERERIWKYIAIGLIALLVGLRFVNLNSDPPLYFVKHGQAMLTDPYHLTFHARNSTLYDNSHPFENHRWDIFQKSIVSGAAYILFALANVSRVTANLAGVLLQLGGFLLFLLGLYRGSNRFEIGLTAFLLLINSSLFFYGRLPFLENGLIFISGLLFFIFARYHERIWGQALCGFLVALAALSGKLFGLLLIGPVLFSLFYVYRYVYRRKVILPALYTLGGGVIGALGFIFIFYGGDFSTTLSYYTEQTVGMYGLPPGLVSVGNFFLMLATFGGESGLHEYTPIITALALICVGLFIMSAEDRTDESRIPAPIIFVFVWLLLGAAGLSPFFYRPIRYSLFLYIPASAICGYMIARIAQGPLRLNRDYWWLKIPLVGLTILYFAVQSRMFFSDYGDRFNSGERMMLTAIIIAVILSGALFIWLNRPRRITTQKIVLPFMLTLVLGATIHQGYKIQSGMSRPGSYLYQYNRDIMQLIDPSATLSGPYTPALTIDNELKGVIYMFGLANKERDLFTKYPISHIVADRPNWKAAQEDFPFLKETLPVVQFAIRNQVVSLYRLPGSTIPLTDFERAVELSKANQHDSALALNESFARKYPENIFGSIGLILIKANVGLLDESLELTEVFVNTNPENYLAHAFCEGFYLKVYNNTQDETFRTLSEKHREIAQKLNPGVASAR